MRCVPEGRNVRCTASAYNIETAFQDVTSTAAWLSTGAAGTFAEPGLFVPTSRGEVTIWASFHGQESTSKTSFLVGPNDPAQPLYWLAGIVSDATTGARLAGATVRILDGYAAGKSAITNEFGAYRIEPILTGEPFTASASKEGYAPVTTTYRVDPPVGPAGQNPPVLDFKLTRQPPS